MAAKTDDATFEQTVRLTVTGTSPLLMKNIQLADPEHPITKEIATYTSKKNKSSTDRKMIEKLEWVGGLYLDPNGRIVIPTPNLKRCIQEAAKANRLGTAVLRGIAPTEMNSVLVYPGSKNYEELYLDPDYTHRALVGVQQKRLVRVRPQFREWSLKTTFMVFPWELDLDKFMEATTRAGIAVGLGDYRTGGYGRFTVQFERL